MLVDNHYSCREIDSEIRSALHKFMTQSTEEKETEDRRGQIYKIFYRNQMSPNYKADEKALKHIIKRNVTPVKAEDKLKHLLQDPTRIELGHEKQRARTREIESDQCHIRLQMHIRGL